MDAELRLDEAAFSLTLVGGAQSGIAFPIGIAGLMQQALRHAPPTALEAEHAIALVEDAIMPFAARIPPGLRVRSASAVVQRVAAAAHGPSAATTGGDLGADAIEALFSRWVRMVHGAPAAREGVPEDAAFAAAIVLLRECMHHLRWAALRWQP